MPTESTLHGPALSTTLDPTQPSLWVEELSRKMWLNRIYEHRGSSGKIVSRIYVIAKTSPGSLLGIGHRCTTGYIFSGKIGVGRSRKNFLINTAARFGSLNVSSDTTWPGTGLISGSSSGQTKRPLTPIVGFRYLVQ